MADEDPVSIVGIRRLPSFSLPALLVAGSGAILFSFAPGEPDPTWTRLSDIGFLFAASLTTLALLTGTERLPPEERRGWRLLTLAVAFAAVGDTVWSMNSLTGIDPSYPGPTDVSYALSYLLLFIAVLRLPYRRGLPAERIKWLLDAAIATAAAGLLMWHTYLGEAFAVAMSQPSGTARVMSGAFVAADLLKISAMVLVIVRPTRFVIDRRMVALGAGLAALIIANVAYLKQIAGGDYWSGNWVSALWFLFYFGLAATAALLDRPGRLSVVDRRDRWYLVLPVYLAVGAMLTHQILDTMNGHQDAGLTIGSALVVLLIVVRQTVANRESRQLLEKHRNDLVASVSHELRTPLSAVHGFTELLIDSHLPADETNEILTLVHEQTSYLNRIVSDLVASARGTLQFTDIDTTPVSVSELIRMAIASSGLGTRIEPEQTEELTMMCDPDRVRQIVVNMLTNADRYGRERILVSASQTGGMVSIEVHDDGPGVPRRYQDLIWEQFERGAHRLDGRVPGSGLGLSIARSLAIAHGGTMTYRSSERLGGACFALQIPAAPASNGPVPTVATAQYPSNTPTEARLASD